MRADSPGKRVYLVRLARGDGVKNPERLEDFAAALTTASGRRYDGSMVSRMENGGRGVSIRETELIAGLDPQHRGAAWIAYGEQKAPTSVEALEDLVKGAVALTPAQLQRAIEQADRIEADRQRAARSERPRRPKSNGGR